MKLGFIGLGRMGRQIVFHLLEKGHEVYAYNRTPSVFDEMAAELDRLNKPNLFYRSETFPHVISRLSLPRIVLMMVTAGQAVDQIINELLDSGLSAGDILVDMGNSYYEDSLRRSENLKKEGIFFIDCGTSGGLRGARYGASLMLGGDRDQVEKLAGLWDALAVPGGWIYTGSSGAGHFVKTIHNGIEYGMNQAIAEGFAVLAKSPYRLNLKDVSRVYAKGSVIRGFLMDLLADTLSNDAGLSGFSGRIGGGKTGSWAKDIADKLGVSCATLDVALEARSRSFKAPDFKGKVVSALRAGYGGHQEPGKET